MLAAITSSYDKEVSVSVPSGKHSDKAKNADLEAIVNQLMESSVFDPSITSKHKSFSTIKAITLLQHWSKGCKRLNVFQFWISLQVTYSPMLRHPLTT